MPVGPIRLLAAAALLGVPAVAQALPAGGPPVGRTSATLESCHDAPDLVSRYATFGAQVTSIPGSGAMSIRFELTERTPGEIGFRPVSGVPGFDVWKSSDPGVGIFGFSEEVSSLSEPAAFRVLVSYRWLASHHRVLRRAKRTTPACSLPVAPSGLVVGSLSRVTAPPA